MAAAGGRPGRSLLDHVDLAAVRRAAARHDGPFATALACLVDGGVLTVDHDDPCWADRDRLVVGARSAVPAVAAWLGEPVTDPTTGAASWVGAEPGGALAMAVGAATSAALDGGVLRAWCLLDDAAISDGAVVEAAALARRAGMAAPALLAVVTPAGADHLAAQLAVAGWSGSRCLADDPAELLGALDHVLGARERPVAALAVREKAR